MSCRQKKKKLVQTAPRSEQSQAEKKEHASVCALHSTVCTENVEVGGTFADVALKTRLADEGASPPNRLCWFRAKVPPRFHEVSTRPPQAQGNSGTPTTQRVIQPFKSVPAVPRQLLFYRRHQLHRRARAILPRTQTRKLAPHVRLRSPTAYRSSSVSMRGQWSDPRNPLRSAPLPKTFTSLTRGTSSLDNKK